MTAKESLKLELKTLERIYCFQESSIYELKTMISQATEKNKDLDVIIQDKKQELARFEELEEEEAIMFRLEAQNEER